jgi:hypothetical protein
MEAKGIAVWQPGIRRRCLERRPPCHGRVPRTHGAMYKNRVEAVLVGRACNTRQSPLSILGQRRILGAHVRKDACSPREICRDVQQGLTKPQGEAISRQKSAEGIVVGGNELGLPIKGEVYPEDSPRRRPERCPDRMVRVNGYG